MSTWLAKNKTLSVLALQCWGSYDATTCSVRMSSTLDSSVLLEDHGVYLGPGV